MRQTASCGMGMEIIAYRDSNHVDIRFDDGTVVTDKKLYRFKNGTIKNPSLYKNQYEGMRKKANCGMMMEIVKYRNATDIDVRFDDGYLCEHRTMKHFRDGEINNPNGKNAWKEKQQDKHIGMEKKARCGLMMKVVEYRNSDDVDVRFEDGVVVRTTMKAFTNNYVRYPDQEMEYIGQKRTSSCGMTMTLIDIRNRSDVDVEFDDGTRVQHRKYVEFDRGLIAHPEACKYREQGMLGEEAVSLCGLKMKIVGYRSSKDIDVSFEDGTIIEHRALSNFRNGKIDHPTRSSQIRRDALAKRFLGKKSISKSGFPMTIVGYRNNDDIDIEFGDGVVLKHEQKSLFAKGEIRHPNGGLRVSRGKKVVRKNSSYAGFSLLGYAFEHGEDVYYICACQKCGYSNILTPQEMERHKSEC